MKKKQFKIDKPNIIPLFVVLLVLMVIMPLEVFSQYEFYYGQNKVIKHSFKWQHVETEHFTIYYYTTNALLVKKVAGAAEQAYAKLSDYLTVKVKEKKTIPLIFYSNKVDFELTNIYNMQPIFSPEAFAESNYYRMVLQGDSSFEELAETITHELGHIFEYEIIGPKSRYISPPLWAIEGFSEFITGRWNPFSLLTVRDTVLYGRVPEMTKYGTLQAPFNNGRLLYYDYGHIIYEFLEEKVGKRGIKKLLYSLRGGSIFSAGGRNILKVLDYTPKLFNYEFGKYLRKRFEKFTTKEDPEDYSYIIGPDYPLNQAIAYRLSPSGEVVAVLTVNAKGLDIDIVLISIKDGKVIKNLTPGTLFGPNYDLINIPIEPADGNVFSWNKDSDKIIFFARKAWDNYLIMIDAMKGEVLKKIKLKNIYEPSSPVFHPDPKVHKIYFSGQASTKSYLYSMDLDTGQVSKLSDGLLWIKAVDISPDGTRIVYSGQSKKYYKLFLAPLDNPNMGKQITFGDYNDVTPSFSADSRSIYYSSDELESYNINKIDLQEKMLYRFTDVKTGNFYPLELPEEKNQVVMISYYKSSFTLFKKDISTPLETRPIQFEDMDKELLSKTEAQELVKVDITDKGKYKPFKKLYIESLPPLSISIGTDGALWGYSYLSLTDLMADHNLIFQVSSFYGYRSYHFFYLNQKKRPFFIAHLFAYKDAYYYNPYVYNPYDRSNYLTLREMYGAETGIWYPFDRNYRLEATASVYKQSEYSDDISTGTDLPYGQFVNGWASSLKLSLVGDAIGFYGYLPNWGHTFKLSFEKFFKLGDDFIDAYTIDVDLRKYFRLDNNVSLALRFTGFKSGGKNALLYWTGGNNTMRSVGFRRLTGNNLFLFNAEFRFPLLLQAWSPLGPLGPIRAMFFFDLGGVWFNGQDFTFFQKDKGIALQDPIASYGFGLEFFFLGYPMHLEWVWRTDLRKKDYYGVNFWIGFDF